ncbi:DUF72 domain-containing protein [Aquincola tertiaricarbonis]|uniref:DUF72 domain-containing protein n=1 Tax=Aquincola tertiaricarbonis TaxID=391953 RepID=UPI00061513E3|nr:DUF72 domain-containing protein [Aquincola tertiaricarbonis]
MKPVPPAAGTPSLFGDEPAAEPEAAAPLQAAVPSPELVSLADRLQQRFGGRLRLGTSSWSFPGWQGLVWGRAYGAPVLARRGLTAYHCHPLLRTVSLDRAFYRPLDAATYAGLAAQVPADFRFVVKAPALVTDALLREPGSGKPVHANPCFLDAQRALQEVLLPAVQGLGPTLGALVFQLSPLPADWLADEPRLHEALDRLWQVLMPALRADARLQHTVVALELRNAALLTPALAGLLQSHGVRYCAGLHDRMPPMAQQLPMLRATWPGDLVCRWNLQRGQRYAQAKDAWAPFDRMQQPDEATRTALARVIVGTLGAGHGVLVTINNKAEGSAPLSVLALAQEVLRQAEAPR